MMTEFANVDVKKFGLPKSIQINKRIIRNLEDGLRFCDPNNEPDKFKLTEMLIEAKQEQLKEWEKQLRDSAV